MRLPAPKLRLQKSARRIPLTQKPRLEVLEDRTVPSNVPPAGLTDWWPGDGSADNIIGGRNGNLVGGATTGPGLVDQAFVLNGNGAYVNIPDNPALNVGTGNFTVELWVKFNSTANEQVLAEKYVEALSPASDGWTLTKLSNNVLRLALTDGGDPAINVDSASLTIPTNTWVQFAARRSGSTITTFMNGAAVASGTCAYNLSAPSSLKFGHRGNPSDTPGSNDRRNFYVNGGIDEVQFYVGTALTNAQILGLYNDSAAGESKPMVVSRANPAAGSTISTPPTDFGVHFSESYAVSSLQAGDFTVNSIGADSFTATSANDVTFHYNTSPVTLQGPQTMQMAAGSVLASDTTLPTSYQSLQAWTKSFSYDAVPMQVASTSPAVGGFINLPNPSLQVTFNEACDPNSLSTGDLTLSQGQVTGFTVSADNTTVTYNLSGLTEGSVNASIPVGVLNDAFGNPLPTSFSATYGVDIGTAPLGGTTPLNPNGSLVYQGAVSGQFNLQVPPFVPSGSGGLSRAIGLAFGPDGNLVVASWNNDEVTRYDGTTGAPLPGAGQLGAVFVTSGSGGLQKPEYLRFGPDGLLYVVSSPTNEVFRYNPDGSFKDIFVTASNNGGLSHPLGLAFDAAGNLYVAGRDSNSVVRFDKNGHPTAFVASGSGGLLTPESLTFGPDGNLDVSSGNSNSILRYNGTTGAFLGALVASGSGGLSYPAGLAFGPDGKLYVSSVNTNSVLRYNGTTGAFLDAFVPTGVAGLTRPTDLAFGPDGKLYVSTEGQSSVLRFDGTAGGPGDVDSFTLDLDANQSLALQVTSSVAPTLTLTHSVLGPITLGPDLDPGPGLQYQAIQFKDNLGNPVAGTVTISIQAPNGLTVGSYTLQATLNAQFDTGGDGSAPVQPTDPSTLDVEPGPVTINRAAVIGSVEKPVARVLTETDGVTNDLRGSWDQVGSSTTWSVNGSGNPNTSVNKGATGSLNATGSSNSKGYDPSDAYSFFGRAGDVITLRSRGSNSSGGTLSATTLTLQGQGVQVTGTAVSGAASDAIIQSFALPASGTYTVTVGTTGSKKGTYTLTADLITPANPRPNTADVYSISATAGQWLSFGVATGSAVVSPAQVQLALYAPGVNPLTGNPVATSSVRGTLDGLLEFDPGTTGTYEVKVTTVPGLTASSANYTLVTVNNGSFDANGSNGSFATAQDITGRPGAVGAQRELTSTFVPAGSGGLTAPVGMVYGPDGNLYVASFGTNSILRYNPTTGALIGSTPFVPSNSGGLSAPTGLFFRNDGKLYVVSQGNNSVLRYDATTGGFIDAFVTSGSGGLSEAQRAAIGPDGNLYVSSGNTDSILRYSGSTGKFIDTFIPSGSGGLDRPHGILFAPDGKLYVAGANSNNVLRYNATTGAYVDTFISAGSGGLAHPTDLMFGPDGNLYVSSWGNDRVLRFDGVTGAFIDAFMPPRDGGLTEPNGLVFDAGGTLYVASFNGNDVLRRTVPADYYQVTLLPGQTVTFSTSTPGDGSGQPSNLLDPHIELYDSNQTLVATGSVLADGRNEAITYTVPTMGGGTYYVKVSRQNLTDGDYVLDPVESGGVQSSAEAPATVNAAGVVSTPLVTATTEHWDADFGWQLPRSSAPAALIGLTAEFSTTGQVNVVDNGVSQFAFGTDAKSNSDTEAGFITGSGRTAAVDAVFSEVEVGPGVFDDPVALKLKVE